MYAYEKIIIIAACLHSIIHCLEVSLFCTPAVMLVLIFHLNVPTNALLYHQTPESFLPRLHTNSVPLSHQAQPGSTVQRQCAAMSRKEEGRRRVLSS